MLKKVIRYLVLGFICLFSLLGATTVVRAADLDEILEYTIWIEPEADGSLDMTYHIKWKVLDSTSEGPLTWVKIGIPNEYVEEITSNSDCIDNIEYLDDGGDYVRIDLDRSYYAGEELDIDFSIHQHRMYQENETNAMRNYTFTPGWFDEAKVDNLMIFWDKEDVAEVPERAREEGEYFYWQSSLGKQERYTVRVSYPESAFTAEDDYEKSADGSVVWILLIFMVGFPVILCIVLILGQKQIGQKDNYDKHRGMGSVYVSPHSHGRHTGGGCACACACAFACAGGGRAGCSRKDFYGTKLETEKMKKILAKGQNMC